MKKLLIGLMALTSISAFAEAAYLEKQIEVSSNSGGGCFVGKDTICKWRLDNCVVKYAVYNYEGDRISDYFDNQRTTLHESSAMRKAGLCRLY